MLALDSFKRDGFAIVQPLLSRDEIDGLINAVEALAKPQTGRGGTRNVLDLAPELRALADHPAVRALVQQVLGDGAFAVRATLFDKTDAANWKVPWHQDVTIAVSSRQEVEGYGPWSMKGDVLHVQPPAKVLDRMVSVRIHLDPCPRENGALRVIPRSHSLGRLNQNHVDQYVDEGASIYCEVEAGGALVMRPLLLHASSAAENPRHRRVVHFDFAVGELNGDLRWHLH